MFLCWHLDGTCRQIAYATVLWQRHFYPGDISMLGDSLMLNMKLQLYALKSIVALQTTPLQKSSFWWIKLFGVVGFLRNTLIIKILKKCHKLPQRFIAWQLGIILVSAAMEFSNNKINLELPHLQSNKEDTGSLICDIFSKFRQLGWYKNIYRMHKKAEWKAIFT